MNIVCEIWSLNTTVDIW